jgi:hypothetical protein
MRDESQNRAEVARWATRVADLRVAVNGEFLVEGSLSQLRGSRP